MVATSSTPDIPVVTGKCESNQSHGKVSLLLLVSNDGTGTFHHTVVSPSSDETVGNNLSRPDDPSNHGDSKNIRTLVNHNYGDDNDGDYDHDDDSNGDNVERHHHHNKRNNDEDSFVSSVEGTSNDADGTDGDGKVYGPRASLIEALYWDQCQSSDVEYCEKVRRVWGKKECGGRLKDAALILADNLLAVFIICPLNILFWQGLWDLLERNVFPHSELLSGITTWLIGLAGIFSLSLSQTFLKKHVKLNKKSHCTPGYQIYTYLLGFSNVAHWHGLWLLIDHYTGLEAISSWTTFIIGQGGLCALRSFATAQSPPTSVTVDIDPEFFTHTTRFQTKPGLRWTYIADTFFTVFVVHNLVVVYWRGTWALMDLYIYPEDEELSALVTLALSYIFHAFSFILQFPLNHLYKRCTPSMRYSALYKILLEQFISTISNAVNVASWRGIWFLSQKYLTLNSHPDLSCAITHSLGIGILMLLLCGQSVGMKGCDLDGSGPDTEGCMLPNSYLRYFLSRRLPNENKCDLDTKASTDTESI